ncbi:MAG: hypothetical protein ABI995_02620, partial [Acidobacteriota bacterium]
CGGWWRRAFKKDPSKRLQAIGDARLLLDADEAPLAASQPVVVVEKAKMPWLWPAVAAVFAISAGLAWWAPWRAAPADPQAVQFLLAPPDGEKFTNVYGAFSVSPDGRYVVFASVGKGGVALWLRSLDSLVARQLPGTSAGNYPFWSPDSKSLVFTSNSELKLKRIDINGGAPVTLADVSAEAAVTFTGAWNADGIILIGGESGLQRVSASGGGAPVLTKVDPKQQESGHGYPQFLPDGKRFLFFVAASDTNVQGIYASSLDDPAKKTLIVRTDAKAVYVPPRESQPGYLLWMQENNLVAQRFDANKLVLNGDPISVGEGIGRNNGIPVRAAFWASEAGALVYFTGAAANRNQIVWMSGDGKRLGDVLPEGAPGVGGTIAGWHAARAGTARGWNRRRCLGIRKVRSDAVDRLTKPKRLCRSGLPIRKRLPIFGEARVFIVRMPLGWASPKRCWRARKRYSRWIGAEMGGICSIEGSIRRLAGILWLFP